MLLLHIHRINTLRWHVVQDPSKDLTSGGLGDTTVLGAGLCNRRQHRQAGVTRRRGAMLQSVFRMRTALCNGEAGGYQIAHTHIAMRCLIYIYIYSIYILYI